MATYNTTSGISDLDGSCVISSNDCTSYTSTSKGAGTVTNLGGSGLNFNVTFTGVTRTFHITAAPNGTGYSGNANAGKKRTSETWAATATQIQPHAAGKRH